jgi:hypothetical protein
VVAEGVVKVSLNLKMGVVEEYGLNLTFYSLEDCLVFRMAGGGGGGGILKLLEISGLL